MRKKKRTREPRGSARSRNPWPWCPISNSFFLSRSLSVVHGDDPQNKIAVAEQLFRFTRTDAVAGPGVTLTVDGGAGAVVAPAPAAGGQGDRQHDLRAGAHVVAINVSPLFRGHSLVLPDPARGHPQQLHTDGREGPLPRDSLRSAIGGRVGMFAFWRAVWLLCLHTGDHLCSVL